MQPYTSSKQQQPMPTFKQGMTLNDYFQSLRVIDQKQEHGREKQQEDLYQTSGKNRPRDSQNIIRQVLAQTVEESEEQSVENQERNRAMSRRNRNSINLQLPEENKGITLNLGLLSKKPHIRNENTIRMKRTNESPAFGGKKQMLSLSTPAKVLSQTLQINNKWNPQRQRQTIEEVSSATFYGKLIKGIKNNTDRIDKAKNSEKQKHFKKKNSQQIEHIKKYEKVLNDKYSKSQLPEIFTMKIQGVSDRLCQRKYFNNRKLK